MNPIMKLFNFIYNIPVLLIKLTYLAPFFIFGLWLMQMLYYPEDNQNLFGKVKKITGIEEHTNQQHEEMVEQATLLRNHFHAVDDFVMNQDPNPQICLTCHGYYAHKKGEKVRSLMNSHSGFLSCTVCHVRRTDSQKQHNYRWVSDSTGKIVSTIEGGYGKYSGKLYLTEILPTGKDQIYEVMDIEGARRFAELMKKFPIEKISEQRQQFHVNISKKPVVCNDCHKKDGYLNFSAIGFTPQRISHLESTEVIGIIEKYEKFYFPEQIDFIKHKNH